jgi:hypothetical protein
MPLGPELFPVYARTSTRRACRLALGACLLLGCAPRPVFCEGNAPCNLAVSPKSRRFVLPATELAYLERSGAARAGTLPAWVTLGKQGDGPRAILLRFDIPGDLEVQQAFVMIDRAEDAEGDGAGVGLYAERIIGGWDAAKVTWEAGPELRDVHAPETVLRPGQPRHLRVDVTALFQRPHGAEPNDHGIALLASRAAPTGVGLTLIPNFTSPVLGDPHVPSATTDQVPRLELYVK